MRGRLLLPFFIYLMFWQPSGFSQGTNTGSGTGMVLSDSVIVGTFSQDSTKHPAIILLPDQAIQYLQESQQAQILKNLENPLRSSIRHLIFEAASPPYDTAHYFLRRFLSDTSDIVNDGFYLTEPVQKKAPEDTLFRSDADYFAVNRDTIAFSKYSGL